MHVRKLFLPDNCQTYNMNNNPKNNILMSENIKQKGLTILEYFDAYMSEFCSSKQAFQQQIDHNKMLMSWNT